MYKNHDQRMIGLRFPCIYICIEVIMLGYGWILANGMAHAGPPEGSSQQFLKEAPSLWQEYRLFADRLQGTVTDKSMRKSEIVPNFLWTVKQNPTCKMILEQSLSSGRQGAYVYNRNYAFSVQRQNDDSPWAITQYIRRRDGANDLPPLIKATDENLCITYYPIRIYSIDLSYLCSQSSFRVKQILPIVQEDNEFVKIVFDNKHPVKFEHGVPLCLVQSGWLVLDPNHCWVMRECDVDCQYIDAAAKIAIKIDYCKLPGKYLIPKKWVAKRELMTDEHPIETSVVDFDLEEPPQLPDDAEFTLSAFGLHEPFGAAKRTILWHRWTALVGVICLVLAMLFRWLSRRAKNKTVA